MKLTLLLLMLTSLMSFGDGYPFHMFNQEVTVDHARIKLGESQQRLVASEGKVTFTGEQLEILRKFYPQIPATLEAVSATYNDSIERVEKKTYVDCIWTAPDEVAVTLLQKENGEEYDFSEKTDGEFNKHSLYLRISPDGKLFHKAREIPLAKAFELIRLIPKEKLQGDERRAYVTLPPPFKLDQEEHQAQNKQVSDLFATLKGYCSTEGVSLQQTW